MTGGNDGHALYAAIDLGSNGANECVAYVEYLPPDPSAIPPRPIAVEAHGVGDDEIINCVKTSPTFRQGIIRDASGHQHFDDRIVYAQTPNFGIWQNINSTANLLQLKPYLQAANIGVNTATPTAKLDVNGTIKAATNVRAMEMCTKTTTDPMTGQPICVKPESVYNITCPSGYYIASVTRDANNALQPNCQRIGFTPPSTNVSCPGGVLGIYTNGSTTCGTILYDN